MSDLERRLRELRAAKSNSVEDDALALRERVRTGHVDEPRLRLAALLGSPGARELLGAAAPSIDREVGGWVKSMTERAPPEAALRVAVATVRHVVPLWERRPERCDRHGALVCRDALCQADPRLRAALERLEACLVSPANTAVAALFESRAAAQQAEADLRAARGESFAPRGWSMEDIMDYTGGYGETEQKEPIALAVTRATLAAIALFADVDRRRELCTTMRVKYCKLYLGDHGNGIGRDLRPDEPGWEDAWRRAASELASDAAGRAVGAVRSFARDEAIARRIEVGYLTSERFEEVRAVVRADVLPWALGRGDPLAARVAARGR